MANSVSRPRKLPRAFYGRPTLRVAPELLGKFLVFAASGHALAARIVEVEAYIGEEDPACHAACGPTMRNKIMYGPPGFAYIYFIYGMYYCLNFVTEPKGAPAAILIRAAEPTEGFDSLPFERNRGENAHLLSGPGKLCRSFGLTSKHNGLDLTGRRLYLEDRRHNVTHIRCSRRIGIRKGADRLWRFFDADSAAVSSRKSFSQSIDLASGGEGLENGIEMELTS